MPWLAWSLTRIPRTHGVQLLALCLWLPPPPAPPSPAIADDGMVQLRLLKRCRRGHYADGATNADTWWGSLLRGAAPGEALPGCHPPAAYYHSPYEQE